VTLLATYVAGCCCCCRPCGPCGQRGVVHKSTGPPGLFQLSPAQPAALVDETEFDLAVADEALALLGLLDRDRFADQRLAYEDEVAGPLAARYPPLPRSGGGGEPRVSAVEGASAPANSLGYKRLIP